MNWLIKLLGGYTAEEMERLYLKFTRARMEIEYRSGLQQPREAQKNDHRDDKGRYTKEGE